jgi:CBS domain-containing protein
VPRSTPFHPPTIAAPRLRAFAAEHGRRLAGSRSVPPGIVSLVGLLGAPVRNQAGQEVGRIVDLVARLHSGDRYPPITGLVIRVGRREAFLDATAIHRVEPGAVHLRTARLDLRDFTRRPGEVLLARDVLDHQLIDIDGVQVIRAADLYLAPVGAATRLVGVDVSLHALLRRLGPRRWRGRPTPERVIDWEAIEPFGEELTETPAAVRLRAPHQALRRLRPGELADLLEDLGRPGRQKLLASLDTETAADALEEMDADELSALLREAEPARAAALLAAMEPDEAVDALRELSAPERAELLVAMPERTRSRLAELLGYRQDRAGGFMTTTLARAQPDETVAEVRARLAERADHRAELDAVAVVDEHGRLISDVALFDLAVAAADARLADLLAIERPAPVTVLPDTEVDEVAAKLIDSRQSSLLVIDPDGRPVGRILADDVLDALTPTQGKLHFPRLLQ